MKYVIKNEIGDREEFETDSSVFFDGVNVCRVIATTKVNIIFVVGIFEKTINNDGFVTIRKFFE